MVVLKWSHETPTDPTLKNRPDLAEITHSGGKRDLEGFRSNGFDF